MQEEILINVTPQETRVALLEDGVLQEVFIDRANNKNIVGNIYLGVVTRILPGMQAAFVDIGLSRSAFLHVRELLPQQDMSDSAIGSMITEGQRILVQVIKPPAGTKGAKLTRQLTIPARNLVLLPQHHHVAVSQKIQQQQTREVLIEKLQSTMAKKQISGGLIIRTASENADDAELEADFEYVYHVWQQIIAEQKQCKAPALVHRSLSLAMRIMRDLMWQRVERIRIDSRKSSEKINQFIADVVPQTKIRAEHYRGDRPIFDLYGVEAAINQALEKRVDLKSGGYLVVDQTEAMTTIDINTGRFVGNKNQQDTVLKTNLEAVIALVRQLRVRNIGGIVIVDFIDMCEPTHCQQVMHTLRHELEKDNGKSRAGEMSNLGLVEITRRRTCESLAQALTESCCGCKGRGFQKTVQTVCYEIFREILRSARAFDAKGLVVIASSQVIDMILEDESPGFDALQHFIGKKIKLQPDAEYLQAQFDVMLM